MALSVALLTQSERQVPQRVCLLKKDRSAKYQC
jgi:hypothetical protein